MIAWLRRFFRPRDLPDNSETMEAVREMKSIAEDVAQGNPVPKDRLRNLETRLTGNIVEDHLRGSVRSQQRGA
jgi:hypothetical protein